MELTTHILTIDDDTTILDAYASILSPYKRTSLEDAIMKLEKLHDIDCSAIDGGEKVIDFHLHQANNGLEGVEIFRREHEAGNRIPVCIVDMRMPNGIDGLETSVRLKEIDPDVNIIIATAYSDRSSKEILECLKSNIFYIRKPFNNEEIYQLVYSLSLSYDATQTIRCLNRDLERRVEEEIQKNRQKDALMLHQAKLAALGELIGNIAHQWRQPLNIISMLCQKISRHHKNGTLTDEIMAQSLADALQTIQHMSQTIDDFRGQVEPNREKVTYILEDTLKSTINLLEKSFALSGVRIEADISAQIRLYGFPEDIKQVVLNLLNNAKDAILSHGIAEGVIRVDASITDDNRLRLNVCDNGGGIEEEVIDKIFEPYFTTKHKAQGTGIGLYMSRRIVEERLGGTIGASNTPGGACLTLDLPITDLLQG